MKMKNLLAVVSLGLLAVVHTSPINTVTQIPTKAEDEVLREAVTDGFLVDRSFLPSLTTESPKRNTTVSTSQRPSPDFEGSATGEIGEEPTTPLFSQRGGNHHSTTTQSVPHSSSTESSKDTASPSSDPSITQSPQSVLTSSSAPDEAQPSDTPDHAEISQTTVRAIFNFPFDEEEQGEYLTTSSGLSSSSSLSTETSTTSSTSTTALTKHKSPRLFAAGEGSGSGEETTTAPSTPTATHTTQGAPPLFIGNEVSGSGSGEETTTEPSSAMTPFTTPNNSKLDRKSVESGTDKRVISPIVEEAVDPAQQQNENSSTPGWIIIVGFIVGVAALVMLCVAIATRDKWNGPRQVYQVESRAGPSNQQRELEMETFLQREEPRQNGKAAEYTEIPLEELPENYSAH